MHIGCSGWNWKTWRPELYEPGLPANRWLERYASVFSTVEINSTFYRLAKPEFAARWAAATPPEFRFVAKASRYLTHIKRMTQLERGTELFYAGLAPLVESGKLTATLWQLPESFQRDDERLANALATLPAGRHAIEFRHKSWFAEDVYALLREHGVAFAYGDTPQRPWVPLEVTADWGVLRFHSGHRGRNHNYSESELKEWAERIRELRRTTELFVYFNNRHEPYALRNAKRLKKLLASG